MSSKVLFTFLATCLCLIAMAQTEDAGRRRNFNLDHNVAMGEFDPVSYHKGRPAKGTSKFSHDYKGVTYYFVNQANLDEFKKTPAKYEPAYGGWCAYAMGVSGDRVKVDPATFKIIDGKVYLFYNFSGNNTLLKWNKEEKKLKSSADYYWRKKLH